MLTPCRRRFNPLYLHRHSLPRRRRRILASFHLDAAIVFGLVLDKERVGFRLRWTGWVGSVQEVLYSSENLLNGNGRPPALFFVQNG